MPPCEKFPEWINKENLLSPSTWKIFQLPLCEKSHSCFYFEDWNLRTWKLESHQASHSEINLLSKQIRKKFAKGPETKYFFGVLSLKKCHRPQFYQVWQFQKKYGTIFYVALHICKWKIHHETSRPPLRWFSLTVEPNWNKFKAMVPQTRSFRSFSFIVRSSPVTSTISSAVFRLTSPSFLRDRQQLMHTSVPECFSRKLQIFVSISTNGCQTWRTIRSVSSCIVLAGASSVSATLRSRVPLKCSMK